MADLTDRELLQLAARAAGLEVWGGQWPQDDMLFVAPKRPDPSGKVTGVEWDPLTDDGDEARLESALGLNVAWDFHSVRVGGATEFFRRQDGDGVKQAARRRAGVRAAAAIAGQPAQGVEP